MNLNQLRFPIILTIFLIGFQTSICFAQNAASEIYKKGAPTTVLIKTDKGGGSGFFVSSSGIVVTAYHVIDGASRVAIKTDAGDIYDEVSLLAKDERKDIAILKIAGFDLPYAELGNSNNVSPGDRIIVLGNPLAVDQLKTSISDGILSGVRDLGDGLKVLQITAPISPGNSGGAVYSSDGKVIGVVSFKLAKGESLNFAVPINYIRGLVESVDANKPLSKWSKSANEDLFAGKSAPDMTGVWKANNGQVLRIRDKGKQVLMVNLTYPETNIDAQWFGDVVLGVIFGGGTFGGNKHFLIKLSESDRLLFYWFDLKSKDSVEDVIRKISEKLKKRPDYVLYRID
jgi:S1-C subfamily serine protease